MFLTDVTGNRRWLPLLAVSHVFEILLRFFDENTDYSNYFTYLCNVNSHSRCNH